MKILTKYQYFLMRFSCARGYDAGISLSRPAQALTSFRVDHMDAVDIRFVE